MQQSPPVPDRHPGRSEGHGTAYSIPTWRVLDGRDCKPRQTHSRRPGPKRPAHRGVKSDRSPSRQTLRSKGAKRRTWIAPSLPTNKEGLITVQVAKKLTAW